MIKIFKKTAIFAVLIAVFCLSLAANGMASGTCPQGKEGYHKGKMYDKVISSLGLTEQQEAQIKEQRTQCKEKFKELKESINTKRQELKKELEKKSIDKTKIDKLAAEITALKGEQLKTRVDTILSIKQILTPEQYEKFQQKMEKMKKHKKGMKKGFWKGSYRCGMKGGEEDEK